MDARHTVRCRQVLRSLSWPQPVLFRSSSCSEPHLTLSPQVSTSIQYTSGGTTVSNPSSRMFYPSPLQPLPKSPSCPWLHLSWASPVPGAPAEFSGISQHGVPKVLICCGVTAALLSCRNTRPECDWTALCVSPFIQRWPLVLLSFQLSCDAVNVGRQDCCVACRCSNTHLSF